MDLTQQDSSFRKFISRDLTDILVRLALVGFLVIASLKIFTPFMGIMLWALILAVTLFPMHQKLAAKLDGKQGRAATLLVIAGILVLGGPTVMLGGSLADYVQQTHTSIKDDSFSIRKPPESVAQWPLIGKKVHSAWQQAATDLPRFIKKHKEQLTNASKSFLGFASGFISGLLQFVFSMVIAGIMMAWGKEGSDSLLKISYRLAGLKKGASLHKLSTATIRSVSLGVIGVAVIQAILIGVGLILIDFPAAGLMALVMLILGIAQLPALLISIPAIIFLWYTGDSSVYNIVMTVYLFLAGLADNVLKPILLGRGVDAPMPVVLIGALGGMVSAGLLGLFIGAVFLSLAYVIFMTWVDDGLLEMKAQENQLGTE